MNNPAINALIVAMLFAAATCIAYAFISVVDHGDEMPQDEE